MIPGGKDSPWKDDGSAILPDSPDLFFVPQTERKREGDQEMIKRSGRKTVPEIFIDGKFIGGCDDLCALEKEGKLDPLLK